MSEGLDFNESEQSSQSIESRLIDSKSQNDALALTHKTSRGSEKFRELRASAGQVAFQ